MSTEDLHERLAGIDASLIGINRLLATLIQRLDREGGIAGGIDRIATALESANNLFTRIVEDEDD